MAVLKRRRRPAKWMPCGNAPHYEGCRISFHRRLVRTGARTWLPMVKLWVCDPPATIYPDGFWKNEAIYGLALRVHDAERKARRDAQRIASLERELAAVRENPLAAWRPPAFDMGHSGEDLLDAMRHIEWKAPRRGLPITIDDWTFKFERDQGFMALAKCDDADALEDRRRA